MWRFIDIFLSLLFVIPVIAGNVTSNRNIVLCENNDCDSPIIADSIDDMLPLKKDIVFINHSKALRNQCYREVNVTIPGTLSDVIGPNVNDIDSIVIKGTINDKDFNTLWSASFNGNLSVINLEEASIENGIIPSRAFWHQDEQLLEDGSIYVIALKRIILPDQIKYMTKI